MKKIGIFACLVLMAFIGMTGLYLTEHAGEVSADSVTRQAVPLLKNRYGITATPEELNKMDGVTATTAELNYTDGVTSNIQTQLDGKTTSTLADTKIFIGNSGGTANAQTVSGLATISNAGVLTGTLADAKVWIGNSGGEAVAVTPSGLFSITNAGVATANANTVGSSAAFINEVAVTVAASGTSGTATVPSASIILGAYGVANIDNIAINGISTVGLSGTTLTLTINGTAGANAALYNVPIMMP